MSDLSTRFYENRRPRVAAPHARTRPGDRIGSARLPLQLALADCFLASSWWYDDQLATRRRPRWRRRSPRSRAPAQTPTIRCVSPASRRRGDQVLHGDSASGDSAVAPRRRSRGRRQYRRPVRMSVYNALSEVLRLTGRTREAIPYQRYHLIQVERTGRDDDGRAVERRVVSERSLSELGEFAAADTALGRARARARGAERRGASAHAARVPVRGRTSSRLGALDSAEAWIARVMSDTTSDAGAMSVWLPVSLAQLRLDQGSAGRMPRAHVASSSPAGLADAAPPGDAARAPASARTATPSGAAALLEGELATIYREPGPPLSQFALASRHGGGLAAGRGRRARRRLPRAARTESSGARLARASRSAYAGRAELLLARALRARGDVTRRTRGGAAGGGRARERLRECELAWTLGRARAGGFARAADKVTVAVTVACGRPLSSASQPSPPRRPTARGGAAAAPCASRAARCAPRRRAASAISANVKPQKKCRSTELVPAPDRGRPARRARRQSRCSSSASAGGSGGWSVGAVAGSVIS